MKMVEITLLISMTIYLLAEAVAFTRATTCRQSAWLISTELITNSLTSGARFSDSRLDLKCRHFFKRREQQVNWKKIDASQFKVLSLRLKGKL